MNPRNRSGRLTIVGCGVVLSLALAACGTAAQAGAPEQNTTTTTAPAGKVSASATTLRQLNGLSEVLLSDEILNQLGGATAAARLGPTYNSATDGLCPLKR